MQLPFQREVTTQVNSGRVRGALRRRDSDRGGGRALLFKAGCSGKTPHRWPLTLGVGSQEAVKAPRLRKFWVANGAGHLYHPAPGSWGPPTDVLPPNLLGVHAQVSCPLLAENTLDPRERPPSTSVSLQCLSWQNWHLITLQIAYFTNMHTNISPKFCITTVFPRLLSVY